ncbi:hypothetical protein D9756_008550 [Leucocoprinus leucothites]|uniref:Uncharacterized protein n=1 Tax=Leucocoprinus leucothites TaxID=201217 RepID=A0A8H5CZC0_9AGAR|nr:hypothetical protein D9756_008550 [Leucoagaricus leucothites]
MVNSVPLPYERVFFTTITTVEGVLYGLNFGIYLFCVGSLFPQLKYRDLRKRTLIMLVHMSLVMSCGLLGLAVDARNMQSSYVDHADFRGGSMAYSERVFARLPIANMGYTAGILTDILTFGIQIWRLWIIWKTSRYSILVIILPTLSLLLLIASKLATIILLDERAPVLTFQLLRLLQFVMESAGLSIAVCVTLFIVARITAPSENSIPSGPSEATSQYTSIISILIESFALESLWQVLSIILVSIAARNSDTTSNASDFINLTQPFIQILAYLLVVYRVTTGRGWQEDTGQKLTTLEWNRDEPQTSTGFNDTRVSLPVPHEGA